MILSRKSPNAGRNILRALAFGTLAALATSLVQLTVFPSKSQADIITDSATSSTVTVTAQAQDKAVVSAPMPDLQVTVSQTRDLTSQAILVSWTGGKKSTRPSGDSAGQNFLQLAQCWGTDANDPTRPDRTTCQYGLAGVTGSTRDAFVPNFSLDSKDQDFALATSADPNTSYLAIPFKAVTGETVSPVKTIDGVKQQDGAVDPNNNQFFTNYTNNQVAWAGSDSQGNGYSKFEVQTVMQSPGLGCGTPIVTGTTAVGSSCWLVVIPRGTLDNGQNSINTPGLLSDSWQHALSVKLDFRPVGVRCSIGSAEKQIAGSELLTNAVASWQPQLCTQPGGSAYVYSVGNEADALTTELSDPNAPLAITSRAAEADTQNQLSYAPVAVAAPVITYAIDRQVVPFGKVPQDYKNSNKYPFSQLNLTPRLLAKLLTASYLDALPPADKSHVGYVNIYQQGHNSRSLVTDPDFLSVNDVEWKYQSILKIGIADAVTPLGRSDVAYAIWSYIMADPDARAFMNGEPDPWGMVVNPYYSTNVSLNPTGVALSLPRLDFPKADPIEKPDNTSEVGGSGAINLVTYRPYVSDFESGAYRVLRGDSLALGAWNPYSLPPAFSKTAGSLQGDQAVIAVSTSASAAKYQTFTAAIQNPAGEFVAPTRDTMKAAMAAATPSKTNSQVYSFDCTSNQAKAATTAYPITMPVYAAVNPALMSTENREAYSAFIRYAALLGQKPGTDIGQLPPGYAPLSDGFVQKALQVSSLVINGVAQNSVSTPTIVPVVPTEPSTGPSVPASVVLSNRTPTDPQGTLQQNAVPYSFAGGVVASLIYPRLRRRKIRN